MAEEKKKTEEKQTKKSAKKETAKEKTTKDQPKKQPTKEAKKTPRQARGKQEVKKEKLPELNPGWQVRVHQKIKEGDKERVQIFEGIIIAQKGRGISKTITVRKISEGIGVEKIFPLSLPTIVKIEVTKKFKVRRAKLYYIRDKKLKDLKETK